MKGQFPLGLIDQLKTLEVTTQTTKANLKAKLLEWCGGAKADDKAVVAARWKTSALTQTLMCISTRRPEKCEALEMRQLAQYKKEMPASLKKRAVMPGYTLTTLVSSRKR